ncbi:MAG: nickel pincer cofactor biosynthesis protein LarB [Candidatus Hadarchaeum sp.]|uniref:nickel pincer cofactor biosynthesis protein LarB n=1 Tax=Candidatus Hadarchaeum sp. TaxID=2883567 RepID=UPI003D10A8FE
MGKNNELPVGLKDVLKKLQRGEITLEEAERRLSALNIRKIRDLARIDLGRACRTGVPEVVFAEGKDPETVVGAAAALAKANGYALITRANRTQIARIRGELGRVFEVEINRPARAVLIRRKGHVFPEEGKVGILAAGTADVPVAEEAAMAARVMGCKVLKAYDVGVAGIHRLFEPLEHMVKEGVSALVVVAGMEGTLPSIVSSLVDVPVIGVPTSIGYGVGVKGVGALITMLQSCSPKLAVVNIDNGFGAGVFAAAIARRAR